MRTLEEIKKELDRRYTAADNRRRRMRRTAAEAALGMMLCSAFALTAVLTYNGGTQSGIYDGGETIISSSAAITERKTSGTEYITNAADTTAATAASTGVTSTAPAEEQTYIPISPEAPVPEQTEDTDAAGIDVSDVPAEPSDDTAPPDTAPTSAATTTEDNGERPITSRRHNTPKYPGGVDPNCSAYDVKLSIRFITGTKVDAVFDISGKSEVQAVELKLERILGIPIVSKNHVSVGMGNIYASENIFGALVTVTDSTGTSREYKLTYLTQEAYTALRSACH